MSENTMPELPDCPWDLDLQCHCLTTDQVHAYARAYAEQEVAKERASWEGDPMFKSRRPESAARQMAIVLMNLLECEMATLEGLEMKKSSSKYEIRRHAQIVDGYLQHIIDLDIPEDTRGLRSAANGRVRDAIRARSKP